MGYEDTTPSLRPGTGPDGDTQAHTYAAIDYNGHIDDGEIGVFPCADQSSPTTRGALRVPTTR